MVKMESKENGPSEVNKGPPGLLSPHILPRSCTPECTFRTLIESVIAPHLRDA
jgi:hypothetical protein